MMGSLVVLALLGATQPAAPAIPWLEFQHTATKATSAALLTESAAEAPQVFDDYLMGDIRLSMAGEMMRFSNEILPDGRSSDAAGSGDDVGGLALLCGILGFFPGFGIGHLIAGNLNGFVIFLCVDIVIAGVFFIWFPLWPGFIFWYVPGLIVFLIERIVEAITAANSALRYRGGRYYGENLPAGGPNQSLPQAKPAFTVLSF